MFTLKVVQVSRIAVDMLAVVVYRKGNNFFTKVREKQLTAPLAFSSAHAKSVHRSWPRSLLTNYWKWVQNFQDFANARDRLVKRFADAHFPEEFVHSIRTFVPPMTSTQLQPVSKGSTSLTIWCVVPYHPCFEIPSFRRSITRFLQDPTWRAVWRDAWGHCDFDIRIAWRTVLTRHEHLVPKYVTRNGRLVGECGGLSVCEHP